MQDSLADKPYTSQPKHRSLDDVQNEFRYKLIIDPSEDDSVIRLLFMFGILNRENTRTFMCSNFPGDSQLRNVSNLKKICYFQLTRDHINKIKERRMVTGYSNL